jgi:ATP-dependent Clp protease ATP-binding subunit ClpC|tara:strand:+ start:20700 stop:23132 length:2433 start_codon:yes stop_codon:yes gene_type:complete
MMGLADYNLTPKAKKGIKDAQKFAEANNHPIINNCHLIYGCLANISDSFSLKLKTQNIKLELKAFIKSFKNFSSQNKTLFVRAKGSGIWHDEVNEAIFFAKEFSDNFDSYFIGPEHILYVVLDMGGDFIEFLQLNGLDVFKLKDIIETHVLESSIPQQPGDQVKNIFQIETKKSIENEVKNKSLEHLTKYCKNLNHEFLSNPSHKISGREFETSQLIEILSKKNKSNAILIGEAGVGKTAVVEGLAQKIAQQDVPHHMSLMQICSVDLSAMVAGTKYRGEFEKRFKALIKEAEGEPYIVLFFDEIHTLIGAGNSEGAVDASNMLKPALARGKIKCIGATTSEEYKKFFEKDSAIKRRFDKIFIKEPSLEETKKIVLNTLSYYEDFHRVKFKESDIDLILQFCENYLSNKNFPDKAFDIIDQIGAKTKIKYKNTSGKMDILRSKFSKMMVQAENEDFDEEEFTNTLKDYIQNLSDQSSNKSRKEKIRQKDIIQVMTEKTGLSKGTVSKSHSSFASFEKKMNSEIFGQSEAIEKIHNLLSCAKVGLTNELQPLANFLFIGPTSVGKTFTAKKIAKNFLGNEKHFIQINMGEYQDKTGIAKLIGANAGYVGYEEGGLLTEFVRNQPNSIVLFDEVEKCDPKILDLLLHLLDEGYCTDNLNRKIDFSNCVMIMTSNIGSTQIKKRSVGFLDDKDNAESIYDKELKKYLRPELLARIEEVIHFKELDKKDLLKIINTELKIIKNRLSSKGFDIKFSKGAASFILEKAISKTLHARDIKNLVKEIIHVPLSKFLIVNKNTKNITVKSLKKEIVFDY